MRVRELIAELQRLDGSAHVVVNGTVVAGVEQVRGRVGGGRHWPDTFRKAADGRDVAVQFLVHTEFSDGTIGLTSVHT